MILYCLLYTVSIFGLGVLVGGLITAVWFQNQIRGKV